MRKLLTFLLLPTLLSAQEKISYDDHILPIFEQACLNCHNPDKTKGGLDLSNFAGAMKGGSSGKIVEPGDSSSTLINAVKQTAEPKMPPEGEKLSEEKIKLIVQWIEGGLLENKSSAARKPSKPKFETALSADPAAKPEGPPPLPEHLLLEPPIITAQPSSVHALAASPWAPLLAVTGQKQILLYHTETLELTGILSFPEGDPISLAFTPDARYLIVGGGIPGKNGLTITFDVTNGSRVVTAGKEFDSILAADIRPGFDIVATGGPSRLLKLWNTQTGEQIKSIKKHTDWITALDISPDGVLLASGDRNGGVQVWEAESANEFHTLRAHQAAITTLVFRTDSNLLASASEDGSVRFWEMNNGSEVKKIDAHGGGVTAFAFAKNGSFVTAGRDQKARLWKADFNQLREIPIPALATAAAIDWEGKRAFVADAAGKVQVFSSEEAGTAEIISFATNPPTIETRIKQIALRLKEAQEKLLASQAADEVRQKTIQDSKDKLAAAQKNHEQANQILQASTQGIEEAQRNLDQLRTKPETPPADIEKAVTALDAARKTTEAAQGRMEPTRQEIETAQKAANDAQAIVGEDVKALETAQTEIALLRSREKSLAAAALNTHALKSNSETEQLLQLSEIHIATFQQSIADLETPISTLKVKRTQYSKFAAALGKSTLSGLDLEEAKATLLALENSIENHRDTLHQKETEFAQLHESINSTSKSLARSKSQSMLLSETYLQALK
ncbi:MAG: c-type cytochrome [Armatimonadetes bacterium]|nr:c-type cytochrome [Akkermansiaceae bacterium]